MIILVNRARNDWAKTAPVKPPSLEITLRREKIKKAWVIERAKTGRSTCRRCKAAIPKGDVRVGVITFYPHRNCRWFHFGTCMHNAILGATSERVWGLRHMDPDTTDDLERHLKIVNATITRSLPGITGELDLPRFASALTARYQRFRSFRFGLSEADQYSQNWDWRCFLATMLVCNTHETAMLDVTDTLFKVYDSPQALLALEDDSNTQGAWVAWMKKRDLRHAARKLRDIIKATRRLQDDYEGTIPNDRRALQKMTGVGRHVASVTMAWVHQAPEFGIDTHVSRILRRWGYVPESFGDVETEDLIKRTIPEKQIGHFSRAFVDHGQQVCGFTPDCENCYLRGSCPTAAKELEW